MVRELRAIPPVVGRRPGTPTSPPEKRVVRGTLGGPAVHIVWGASLSYSTLVRVLEAPVVRRRLLWACLPAQGPPERRDARRGSVETRTPAVRVRRSCRSVTFILKVCLVGFIDN